MKAKPGEDEGVYYMKQTVRNGCGTVALIHAVANNESRLNLKPDSVVQKFLNATKDLSPEEKGKYLEQDIVSKILKHNCLFIFVYRKNSLLFTSNFEF